MNNGISRRLASSTNVTTSDKAFQAILVCGQTEVHSLLDFPLFEGQDVGDFSPVLRTLCMRVSRMLPACDRDSSESKSIPTALFHTNLSRLD